MAVKKSRQRQVVSRACSLVIGLAAASAMGSYSYGQSTSEPGRGANGGGSPGLPQIPQFDFGNVDQVVNLDSGGAGMGGPEIGSLPPGGGVAGGTPVAPAPLSVIAGGAILGARLMGRRRGAI